MGMPLVGTTDIAMGILALFLPIRGLLLWATFWTFWTALLRPLTGEGGWEFLERGGNYRIPLALLVLCGMGTGVKDLFARLKPALNHARAEKVSWILRITTAILLIGHGGFGAFMHKKVWLDYFGAIGISQHIVQSLFLISALGWFEIALALLVLIKPAQRVLLFVFAWNVLTELLRPLAGEPFWEFIERFGSYAAPLALIYVNHWLGIHLAKQASAPAAAVA